MKKEIQAPDNPDLPADLPIDRTSLQLLATHKLLNAEEIEQSYIIGQMHPQATTWYAWMYRLFMAAGTLLMLAGIMFFFAYNWAGLHKFVKLGLVQGAIVLIGGAIILFKPKQFIRQLGLTSMSVLVGVLMAVFGQIYQTGADAYDLFWAWTVCISLWVLIARFHFLWLFYIALINTTVLLYMGQVQMDWSSETVIMIVASINSFALLLWEFFVRHNRQQAGHLLCMRLLGFVAMADLTVAMLMIIIDASSLDYVWLHVLFYLAWVVGGFFYYVKRQKDIAFVAQLGISILLLVNAVFLRIIFRISEINEVYLLIFSVFNIIATTILVKQLLRIYNKWNRENQFNNHKNESIDAASK